MYHRFEENKYPSTNIRMSQFLSHISFIEDNNLKFINPKKFLEEIKNNKEQRKVLLTIDDGFSSFYISAWPILKKKKIPFILFISTREVGKNGYMTWDQIREIQSYKFTEIGNHSHSHEYLIDFDNVNIRKDIETSIKLFKKELGQNSDFFSYPFGEYSIQLKNIIIDFDFKFALGQHSGVIDETKDSFELPRFPINEKYGEMKRFKSLMKTLPFKYKKITPEQKYINNKTNPPDVNIEFFDDINLDRINCFSNEGNKWKNSSISFINPNKIKINLKEKFTTERGRINCSLRESDGFYRWLGIQFVVAEK
ncbi:MAG: polysaccharide deacetylase [Candidatus Pelagibacter sp.]|nr:polysaccharide deacetylase [Candidatus Pelagibacter sp.]